MNHPIQSQIARAGNAARTSPIEMMPGSPFRGQGNNPNQGRQAIGADCLMDMVRSSQIIQKNPSANFSAAMGNSLIESYLKSPPDRIVDLMGKGREFLGAEGDGLWRKQQPMPRAPVSTSSRSSAPSVKQIQSSVLTSVIPGISEQSINQNQPVSLAISVATNPSLLSCVAPAPPQLPKIAEVLAPSGTDISCNSPGDIYAKLLRSSSKSIGISSGEALLALGAHIATASWGYERELGASGLFDAPTNDKKQGKKPSAPQPLDPRFGCVCAVRAYLEREYRDSLEHKKGEPADIIGTLNRSGRQPIISPGIGTSGSAIPMGVMSQTNRFGHSQMLGQNQFSPGFGYMGYGNNFGTNNMYSYGGYYQGIDGIDGVGFNTMGNTFLTAEQKYPNGLRSMVPAPISKGPTTITNISNSNVKQALNRLVLVHPQLLNVNLNVTTVLHPALIPGVTFVLLRAGMRTEAMKLIKSLVMGVNNFGRSGGAMSGLTSGDGEERSLYNNNSNNNNSVASSGIGVSGSDNPRTPIGLNSGHGIGPLLSYAIQGFCKDPTKDTWDGSETAASNEWYIPKGSKSNIPTKSKLGGNVITTGASSPTAENIMSQSGGYCNSGVSARDTSASSPGCGLGFSSLSGPADEDSKCGYSSAWDKNELSKALVKEFQNYKNTLTAVWSNSVASNSIVVGASQVISNPGTNTNSGSGGGGGGGGTGISVGSSGGNRLGLSLSGTSIPSVDTPVPVIASVAPCVRALHLYYLALLYTLTSRMCVSEQIGQGDGRGPNTMSQSNSSTNNNQLDTALTPLLPALDTAAMDTGVGTSMAVGVMCVPCDVNCYQWYYSKGKSADGDGEFVPVASGSVLSLADYLWIRMSMVDEGRKDSRHSLRYQDKLMNKVTEKRTIGVVGGESPAVGFLNSMRNSRNASECENNTTLKNGKNPAVSRTSLAALQAEIRSLPAGYFSGEHTQSGFNTLSSSAASGAMQLCACCLCSLQFQEAMYALVGSTPASTSTVTAYSMARGQIVSHGSGPGGFAGGLLAECGGWMGVRSCSSSSLELAASLALVLLSGRCREQEQIENLFETYGLAARARAGGESRISLSSNISHPLTVPLGLLAPLMAVINSNAWSPHLVTSIMLLLRGNVYNDPDEYTRSALTILGSLVLAHSPDPLLGLLGPEFIGNTPSPASAPGTTQQRVGDFVSAFYKHPLLNILSVKLPEGVGREVARGIPRLNCEMFANALRIAAHWAATGGGIPISINSVSGINSIISSTGIKGIGSSRNYLPPVAACKFRAILLYALCTEADRLGLMNDIDIARGMEAFALYGVIEVVSCDATLLSMLCSLVSETLCVGMSSIAESINRSSGNENSRLFMANGGGAIRSVGGMSMPASQSLKSRMILLAFSSKVTSVFKNTLSSKRSEYVDILINLTDALYALDDYQRQGQNQYYGDIQLMFYRIYKAALESNLRGSIQPTLGSTTLDSLGGSVSVVSSAVSTVSPVVLRVLRAVVIVYKTLCLANGGGVDDIGNTSGFSVDRAYGILGGVLNIF